MNTELLDDDQRDALLPAIEYVDPPEREETSAEPLIKEKPEPPKLNRAQRRRLSRYILRKARQQFRRAAQKVSSVVKESRGPRCQCCGLLFIGRAELRCQCKAIPQRHVENEAAKSPAQKKQ